MNNPLNDKIDMVDDLLKHSNQDHPLHDVLSHDHHSAFGHHFEHHNHQHHLPNADFHSASDNTFHLPPNTLDYLQSDLGNYEQHQVHSYQMPGFDDQMIGNVQSHHDHGHLHYHEHIACSSKTPETYTSIGDDGKIYKYSPNNSDGTYVGQIKNLHVYSGNSTYLGYGCLDGKIYDADKTYIGWVDSDGHVYNTSGVEVYQTTRGVAGATAYMLCVYVGGIA